MNKIVITALTALLVTACSPQNEEAAEDASQMQGVAAEASKQPKRDVSTAALVKIDPDIQEYDDNVQTALSAYEADAGAATKQALVDAYIAFADYMTYQSPVSPREGKYHRALLEYRHALNLDPENNKAMVEIAQIEDIYRSMNRPVPGDE
ncbi:MAG: hypothetical protein C0600_08185 [Ignavibacteria bacterium]|nr:MAG: hypothetical protein C0600_08185 [Ignavibacteria bacterium]